MNVLKMNSQEKYLAEKYRKMYTRFDDTPQQSNAVALRDLNSILFVSLAWLPAVPASPAYKSC